MLPLRDRELPTSPTWDRSVIVVFASTPAEVVAVERSLAACP